VTLIEQLVPNGNRKSDATLFLARIWRALLDLNLCAKHLILCCLFHQAMVFPPCVRGAGSGACQSEWAGLALALFRKGQRSLLNFVCVGVWVRVSVECRVVDVRTRGPVHLAVPAAQRP